MKTINWFDWAPRGRGWLALAGLKAGELVLVNRQVYRYSVERQGTEHILTPVEPIRKRT